MTVMIYVLKIPLTCARHSLLTSSMSLSMALLALSTLLTNASFHSPCIVVHCIVVFNVRLNSITDTIPTEIGLLTSVGMCDIACVNTEMCGALISVLTPSCGRSFFYTREPDCRIHPDGDRTVDKFE